MRQVAAGAVVFAVLAGCGGQPTLAPSESAALPNAQGVVCGLYPSAAGLAQCAGAGATSTLATIAFRVPRSGPIQISAVTRALRFEDYPSFRLTCDDQEHQLRALSGRFVPQPDWFKTVPGMTSAMGAQDLLYAADAPLAANSFCVLALSFYLEPEGLPYIPYDLTIRMQAP